MTDFKMIYASRAAEYDQLVSCEDVDGNILRTLQEIRPLAQQDVVEFGAGSGRLTRLLLPHVHSLFAFDQATAMLRVARARGAPFRRDHWLTAVADHRAIPLASTVAEIALEGWAFGHFVGWNPDSWESEVEKSLAEMKRIVRPGGVMILLETMGTGHEVPTPPEVLIPLYAWLEKEKQFNFQWIRTDYQFKNEAEAERLLHFFFGPEMAAQARETGGSRFPECTGIWHKVVK